jgi:hypothetical protein
LEDLGVDRRIILKLVLKKWGVRVRIGLIWFRTGYNDEWRRQEDNIKIGFKKVGCEGSD